MKGGENVQAPCKFSLFLFYGWFEFLHWSKKLRNQFGGQVHTLLHKSNEANVIYVQATPFGIGCSTESRSRRARDRSSKTVCVLS